MQDKSGFLIWFWLDRRVTAQWTAAELRGYCGLALQIFRTSSQKEFVHESGKLPGEVVGGGKNWLHYISTLRGWSPCWEINGTHYQGWNIKNQPNSFSHWNKAFNIRNVNPTTSLTENVTSWSALAFSKMSIFNKSMIWKCCQISCEKLSLKFRPIHANVRLHTTFLYNRMNQNTGASQ